MVPVAGSQAPVPGAHCLLVLLSSQLAVSGLLSEPARCCCAGVHVGNPSAYPGPGGMHSQPYLSNHGMQGALQALYSA